MIMHQRVNICFHGIGEPKRELETGESSYWISEEFFNQSLDLIERRDGVGISFDDGNISDFDIALPALRTRGLRAAFFPIAARLGRPGSVGREHLRAFLDAGMTVGSHGMHHQPWRGLSDEALDEELVEARTILAEQAGAPISAAACPLGRYDRRVLSRLRSLGYSQIFTSDRGVARASAWLQPRYSVRNSDSITEVEAILAGRPALAERVVSNARITAKRWR